VPGQSLKQAIVWPAVAALLVTVAATVLMLAAPDLAQAASDTSKKVGDEAKGWLTVLFLVVAGFAALPVIGRLDVGRGFALAALVLILGGFAFAQNDVRSAVHSIWSSIG
jgi:cobalamin synthase